MVAEAAPAGSCPAAGLGDGSIDAEPRRTSEPRPTPPDPMLPTSNVWFYCEDLAATHKELSARGVEFPQPPVELFFGWWSIFSDPDGNRFVLMPRGT